jgi:hypothetical protein
VCVVRGVGGGKKRGMEGLEKLNLITVFDYQIGQSRRHSTGVGDCCCAASSREKIEDVVCVFVCARGGWMRMTRP